MLRVQNILTSLMVFWFWSQLLGLKITRNTVQKQKENILILLYFFHSQHNAKEF